MSGYVWDLSGFGSRDCQSSNAVQHILAVFGAPVHWKTTLFTLRGLPRLYALDRAV